MDAAVTESSPAVGDRELMVSVAVVQTVGSCLVWGSIAKTGKISYRPENSDARQWPHESTIEFTILDH